MLTHQIVKPEYFKNTLPSVIRLKDLKEFLKKNESSLNDNSIIFMLQSQNRDLSVVNAATGDSHSLEWYIPAEDIVLKEGGDIYLTIS